MNKQLIERAETDLYLTMTTDADWFTAMLIRLMLKADSNNMRKLAHVYPEVAYVVTRYKEEEGYWDKLMTKINNSNADKNV